MSISPEISTKYYKLLGNRFRELRKERKLSLNDLAAICDLEKTSISRIEHGRTNVTFKTILVLCIGLKVNFSDVFNFDIEEGERRVYK